MNYTVLEGGTKGREGRTGVYRGEKGREEKWYRHNARVCERRRIDESRN